jgi:fibronectin-binding autotransporter adhesin
MFKTWLSVRYWFSCFLAAGLVFFVSSPASAADYTWNVASGDWSDTSPSPWSLGSEPTNTDTVYIANGGTATITKTGEVCDTLYLGGSNTGLVEMTNGSFTASHAFIGNLGAGAGTFTQTGGTNSTYELCVGGYSAPRCTYNLGGTAGLSAYCEYIGFNDSGIATFTQTGGTNTTTELSISSTAGSSSTYSLSAGQLSAQYEMIGPNGQGAATLMQTGGTNATGGIIISSNGTYSLSGTGQLTADYELIGSKTFAQTAGINTATSIVVTSTYVLAGGTLNVNGGLENRGTLDLSNSSAVVNLNSALFTQPSPGAITAKSGNATINIDAHSLWIVPAGHTASEYFAHINNSGIIHQAGSALDIPSDRSIYGIGTIDDHVKCAGTLSATTSSSSTGNFLRLNLSNGVTITGTGNVNLGNGDIPGDLQVKDAISGMDGGSLSAGSESIGRATAGTFTQRGGTNSASCLYLGRYTSPSWLSIGTYNLSGTGQMSISSEYIGDTGTSELVVGKFNQSGSTTNSAKYLKIGDSGAYVLSEGTLNINGGIENQGTWDLSNSSAVVNVTSSILILSGNIVATAGDASINIDEHSLVIVPVGRSPADYFAKISNLGIIHQTGSALDIPSARNICGTGIINDFVNCQGDLSATTGYGITLSGGLNVSGDASVNLGTGNLYVNDVNSGMGGGSLSAANLYIGSTGTGTFTQSGGTISISSNLCLGNKSGSTGVYNLNGGTLLAWSLSEGPGTYVFNFRGGTLRASSYLTTSLPMTLTGTGGNANIDTAGYVVTLQGSLSGTGGLNKLGSGTLRLCASNTYRGDTRIYAGELMVIGSLNTSGEVNVNSSGTLSGNGTVGQAVVNYNGHVSPGDAVAGTLTLTGDLHLLPGAILDFDLASPSASDKIAMGTSTLYINNLDLSAFNFSPRSGLGMGTYTLIDAGTISGNLGSNLDGTIGGLPATLSISGNDLVLTVVPEPVNLVLLATAALGLIGGALFNRKRYSPGFHP